jgi:hypothetical protein
VPEAGVVAPGPEVGLGRTHRSSAAAGRDQPRLPDRAARCDARFAEREEIEMSVMPGDVSPSVDLPDDAGRHWRLADQRGRTVVLIFHRHLA